MNTCPSVPPSDVDVIKVLLIEDSQADAVLVREALSDAAGDRVRLMHANGLSAGLSLLGERTVDAVLLDLSLPESQGLETLQMVYDQAPEVPIVIITGLTDEATAIQAVKRGAQDYLLKSETDSQALARSIHHAIARNQAERALRDALEQAERHKAETTALLQSSRAILEHREFSDAARCIFDSCKQLIGATAGYVALLNPDGTENEVLFLDSGGLSCTVDPSLPMPIRGLRSEAYRTGQVVYDNSFAHGEWSEYLPEGHVALENVLFSPLNIEGRTAGLLGLANKPGGFTDRDARLATAFGELAAIALRNGRTLSALEASETKYRDLVQLHQSTLDTVPSSVLVLDHGLNVLMANRRYFDVQGVAADEATGHCITDLFPEELLVEQSLLDRIQTVAREGGQDEALGVRHVSDDHADRYLDFRICGIPSEQGVLAEPCVLLIFEDVTERMTLAEHARQTSKLESIGRLAGGIAHDFNNILTGIKGYSDLLLGQMGKTHPAQGDLEAIKQCAGRAPPLHGSSLRSAGSSRCSLCR